MIARIGLDAFCLWASEEVEKVRQIEKNAELAVYGSAALKKLREGNVDEITFPLAVDLEPPASHSEQRSTENLGKHEAEPKRRSSRPKRDGRRKSDPERQVVALLPDRVSQTLDLEWVIETAKRGLRTEAILRTDGSIISSASSPPSPVPSVAAGARAGFPPPGVPLYLAQLSRRPDSSNISPRLALAVPRLVTGIGSLGAVLSLTLRVAREI
jgi:hypothetical protein